MKKFLHGYGGFFLLTVIVFAAAIYVNLPRMLLAKDGGDSSWYMAMAEGRIGEVIEPYSARFLHTFLAGWLANHFSLGVAFSFLLVAVISLLGFFLINGVILKKAVRSPLLLASFFLLPYFVLILRRNIQPDALNIFLTALFFLFLFYKKESASFLILFLLFLNRETTILLGLVLIVTYWLRRKKLLAATALIVVLISMGTSGFISGIGQPNTHNVSTSVFMLLKFAYHSVVNVLGLRLWVSGYDFCAPIFKLILPPFNFLGTIKEAGFCGFDPSLPLKTLIALLSTFGIAPVVFARIFLKEGRKIFARLPVWTSVAITSGILHYLISVPAGTGIQRIVGYGWPVFLLATPFLAAKFFEIDRKCIIKLLSVQLFVAWLPFVLKEASMERTATLTITLCIILAAYWYAMRIVGAQEIRRAPVFEE
ncbi:MAG: hypothetical protein Q8R20_02775 [Nanoarchaeota archaeon]|nr:hypothetical protein [Nanoarchaeota archaeon]